MTAAQTGMYPNPASAKTWTDATGRVWHRRGQPPSGITPKRARTLLRSPTVPLATWWAGDLEWFEGVDAKEAAAAALAASVSPPGEVVPWEWKADDGTHLLILEHHC